MSPWLGGGTRVWGPVLTLALMAHAFGLILDPVSESARDGTPTGRLFMQRSLLSADFKAI